MADAHQADAVYLSPHLDDAALSCGGQIAERAARGDRVLVVTVFTGDQPAGELSLFARRLHRYWRLSAGVVAARRREDRAACVRLGARAVHWSEVEAIYRRDQAAGGCLYPDRDSLFDEPAATDAELEQRIADRLRELPSECPVFAPLAAGGHVDHWLVRRAAEAACGDRLIYYEDYPYVVFDARAAGRAMSGGHWTSEVIPLSATALEAKIGAIGTYASQIPVLFRRRRRMARMVRRFTRRTGGERLWKRTGSGRSGPYG